MFYNLDIILDLPSTDGFPSQVPVLQCSDARSESDPDRGRWRSERNSDPSQHCSNQRLRSYHRQSTGSPLHNRFWEIENRSHAEVSKTDIALLYHVLLSQKYELRSILGIKNKNNLLGKNDNDVSFASASRTT